MFAQIDRSRTRIILSSKISIQLWDWFFIMHQDVYSFPGCDHSLSCCNQNYLDKQHISFSLNLSFQNIWFPDQTCMSVHVTLVIFLVLPFQKLPPKKLFSTQTWKNKSLTIHPTKLFSNETWLKNASILPIILTLFRCTDILADVDYPLVWMILGVNLTEAQTINVKYNHQGGIIFLIQTNIVTTFFSISLLLNMWFLSVEYVISFLFWIKNQSLCLFQLHL